MAATLKEQLIELADLAPRVHATTDRVNGLVAQMEGVLVNDLGVGLESETRAFDDRILANKTRVTRHLCLGTLDGRAQIYVIERTWAKDGDLTLEVPISWSSCAREAKLKAIAVLPDLVANLVADARRLMDEANETANKVAGWIGGEETTPVPPVAAPAPQAPTPRRRGKK